jgi:hypothetical protein
MALRRLPADIVVLAGNFGDHPAAQPLVFAHLWDVAPDLDLGHVEVVPAARGEARLASYFDDGIRGRVARAAGGADTLVLVLPEAWEGLEPPKLESARLRSLGTWRGQLRRQVGA